MKSSVEIHQYEVKCRIIRQVKYNFDHYILLVSMHVQRTFLKQIHN
jgi:hypothetical protein